jgi:hypothetical protein
MVAGFLLVANARRRAAREAAMALERTRSAQRKPRVPVVSSNVKGVDRIADDPAGAIRKPTGAPSDKVLSAGRSRAAAVQLPAIDAAACRPIFPSSGRRTVRGEARYRGAVEAASVDAEAVRIRARHVK